MIPVTILLTSNYTTRFLKLWVYQIKFQLKFIILPSPSDSIKIEEHKFQLYVQRTKINKWKKLTLKYQGRLIVSLILCLSNSNITVNNWNMHRIFALNQSQSEMHYLKKGIALWIFLQLSRCKYFSKLCRTRPPPPPHPFSKSAGIIRGQTIYFFEKLQIFKKITF